MLSLCREVQRMKDEAPYRRAQPRLPPAHRPLLPVAHVQVPNDAEGERPGHRRREPLQHRRDGLPLPEQGLRRPGQLPVPGRLAALPFRHDAASWEMTAAEEGACTATQKWFSLVT
uniref:Uncharacterized protein n=1 Tax=Steinernema glaseri TaxID=37863 RepID=A0A1I8AJW4_9BILA